MSYTLRGRLESRLAALAAGRRRGVRARARRAPLVAGRGRRPDGRGRRSRSTCRSTTGCSPTSPAGLALPLGALELGAAARLDARSLGIAAPLGPAIALFAGGWLARAGARARGLPAAAARLCGGRRRARPVGARRGGRGRRRARRAPAATAYARLPPVVHLAAGVHQGPLVITRREVLVGEPGAVVRGGIVVRANGVTIRNVTVVGGENGITVDGVRDASLDGVSVSGASSTASTCAARRSDPELHDRHARQRVRPGDRHLVLDGLRHEHGRGLQRRRRHGGDRHPRLDERWSWTTASAARRCAGSR